MMKTKQKELLLIDGDFLKYKHNKDDTLQTALNKVDGYIDEILGFAKPDGYAFFISEGRYFRHDLATSYKSKRTYPLPWCNAVKEYLKQAYKAVSFKGVEADDLVVYFNNKEISYYNDNSIDKFGQKEFIPTVNLLGQTLKFHPVKTTIVSNDKDILECIKGNHINPCKKNKTNNQFEVLSKTTSETEALYNFWVSMIAGDTSDGIVGIFGCGKAAADSLFKEYIDEKDLINRTLNKYIKTHGSSTGIFKFQQTYRQLKMLDSDELFIQEIGKIPKIDNIVPLAKLETPPLTLNDL